jgi:hypothetical protein
MFHKIGRIALPIVLSLPILAVSCYDRSVVVEVQEFETEKPMGILELVFPEVPPRDNRGAEGRWRCQQVRSYVRPDTWGLIGADLVRDHPWDKMVYRFDVVNNYLEVTVRPGESEDWLLLSFDAEGMTKLEGFWNHETDGGFVDFGPLRIVRSKPPADQWPVWWQKGVK